MWDLEGGRQQEPCSFHVACLQAPGSPWSRSGAMAGPNPAHSPAEASPTSGKEHVYLHDNKSQLLQDTLIIRLRCVVRARD